MNRAAALISVLSLFVVGILAGALGMHVYDSRQPDLSPGKSLHGARPPHPSGERLERRLGLDEEQRRQLETILRESRAEGEALRAEMEPRVREHMERTHSRIREILTPAQAERFDEMLRHEHRRLNRFLLSR